MTDALCRATHVQMEDGSVVLLHAQRPAQRLALARRLLTPGKPGSTLGACKKASHCIYTCIHNYIVGAREGEGERCDNWNCSYSTLGIKNGRMTGKELLKQLHLYLVICCSVCVCVGPSPSPERRCAPNE